MDRPFRPLLSQGDKAVTCHSYTIFHSIHTTSTNLKKGSWKSLNGLKRTLELILYIEVCTVCMSLV